ncbi:MAG: NUDIX hydrolase [Clostridiales bacterium]
MIPKWLKWAKELQSLSQSGLNYTENPFEIERYKAIMKVSAEIMAEYSSVETEKIIDLFSRQAGHATPRVDVRGVVFRDGRILLVKEKLDGKWTLPGGWADPNETPSHAVEREVFEESGFIVKAEKLLALYDRDKQGHKPPHPFHVYKIFFLCEITGGKKTLSNETDDIGFFTGEEIPELSEARTTIRQLRHFFKMYNASNWDTDFD